mmetsp:Transcript_102656/g.328989  ORF Transcript_102656/g.328989 Transcript_102656/m.328989 type:complete len:210 (+) Transcript_102656:1976-2605(+)
MMACFKAGTMTDFFHWSSDLQSGPRRASISHSQAVVSCGFKAEGCTPTLATCNKRSTRAPPSGTVMSFCNSKLLLLKCLTAAKAFGEIFFTSPEAKVRHELSKETASPTATTTDTYGTCECPASLMRSSLRRQLGANNKFKTVEHVMTPNNSGSNGMSSRRIFVHSRPLPDGCQTPSLSASIRSAISLTHCIHTFCFVLAARPSLCIFS